MSTVTIDQVLDTIDELSFEQQEMLVDIIYKRLLETRRQKIAQDAQESLNAFHQGQYLAQSADMVLRELHESFDQDDV